MKRQDLNKFHQQSVAEIELEIKKLEAQLIDAKMKTALAQVKNVRQSKMIRHDIARLKTIIRMKQLTTTVAKNEEKS